MKQSLNDRNGLEDAVAVHLPSTPVAGVVGAVGRRRVADAEAALDVVLETALVGAAVRPTQSALAVLSNTSKER